MARLPAKQVRRTVSQAAVKEAFDKLGGQVGIEVSGAVAPGGEVFTRETAPAPAPVLTLEEQHEKQTLIKVLQKWLVPAQTSTKTDPEKDRVSFNAKLNGQTLDDLWRFFDIDIPAEVKVLMQSKYRDISP